MQLTERQIMELRAKLTSANQTIDDWQLRYDAAQVQHQVDLNVSLNNLRQQLEVAHHAEIHQVKQEGLPRSFHASLSSFVCR